MSKSAEIHKRLSDALAPTTIDVRNDSSRHSGHSGDDGSGESHFHVMLRSPAFEGKTRIARHRMVHQAMGAELVTSIHALSLDLDV
ncbi:BolA family protein [Pelagimonas varians]|jgi:BolA protein|uniref:Transcriptional regulator BolA n=1 Tax=Pelagimonas varians TaxID=696760 RepID=A0A238KD10_9RHOB|nr:BolA family protein [Pelagimonas varians]PYG29935.1 BolA protein [Pelagimonas varians]SMX40715.1 transcriptional regulator BolA [Pelagimonas varians]